MDVKGEVTFVKHICAQTPAADAPADRYRFAFSEKAQQRNGYVNQLITDPTGAPDCPQHQDEIVSSQMLDSACLESFGVPWLAFGGAKLGDIDQAPLGADAGFGLEGNTLPLDLNIITGLVHSAGGDDREGLVDCPKGAFNKRLKIDPLRRDSGIDRMMDIYERLQKGQKLDIEDAAVVHNAKLAYSCDAGQPADDLQWLLLPSELSFERANLFLLAIEPAGGVGRCRQKAIFNGDSIRSRPVPACC
ncbi:MAG TPA: hypothetical protein VNV39_20735, partial [Stellaceae bacterium]|nr:hypothetical protein [Stellaceae bacterium]